MHRRMHFISETGTPHIHISYQDTLAGALSRLDEVFVYQIIIHWGLIAIQYVTCCAQNRLAVRIGCVKLL